MTTESTQVLPTELLSDDISQSIALDARGGIAPFGYCRQEGCLEVACVDSVGYADKCTLHHFCSGEEWCRLPYTQRLNLVTDYYRAVERLPISVAIQCAERNISRRNYFPQPLLSGWRSLCQQCMMHRPEDGPYGNAQIGNCPHNNRGGALVPEVGVPGSVSFVFSSFTGTRGVSIHTPTLVEVRELVGNSMTHQMINECLDL